MLKNLEKPWTEKKMKRKKKRWQRKLLTSCMYLPSSKTEI